MEYKQTSYHKLGLRWLPVRQQLLYKVALLTHKAALFSVQFYTKTAVLNGFVQF